MILPVVVGVVIVVLVELDVDAESKIYCIVSSKKTTSFFFYLYNIYRGIHNLLQ